MSLFTRVFGVHRKRSASTAARQNSVGRLESLEGRRMLAADASVMVGDSNFDGRFDSSDMVAVFSHGKFETGEEATFAEGDWNSDGYFNSGDFVTAFQANTYEQPVALAADVAEGEDGDPVDADNEDVDGGEALNEDGGNHRRHRGNRGPGRGRGGRDGEDGRERPSTEERIQSLIDNIQGRIDAGLGEDVDVEAVQAAVTAAAEALAAGDADAAKEALAGLRGQVGGDRDRGERPSAEERIQNAINKLQERIDGGELPDGVDADAIQASVTAAGEALAAGDVDAAKAALKEVQAARQQAAMEARVSNAVTNLQARIDAGELPEGADADAIQAAVTTAADALAAGDLDAAKEALKGIRGERGDRERPSAEERVQGLIERLQARVDEGLPDDVDAAAVQAAIDAAKAALEAGDVDAAREALAALRPDRGDGDRPDRDGRPGRDRRGDRNGRDRAGQIRDRIGELRDRMSDRIQEMRAAVLTQMVERLQHAIENGNLPEGADADAIQSGVAVAAAALEAGDLDAAREALKGLRPDRGDGPDDEGNGDAAGDDGDADGEGDQDGDRDRRPNRRPVPAGRATRGRG